MNKQDFKKIKEHWNEEAKKGIEAFDKIFPLGYAGTYPDYNMQHLEMNAILKYLNEGDKILDIGCGKGYGALYMVWKKKINLLGLDYAEEMISESNRNLRELEKQLKGTASFVVGDILKPETLPRGVFDVVYTERCLINITNWEEQKKAIKNISDLVKDGGLFIMQEGSKTSLDKLNQVRMKFGLKPIEVVWHNLFFEDERLINYSKDFFEFIGTDDFSSMFTLVSRALHPALIAPEEPSYKTEINKLALELPNLGDYGYQKIYIFRKKK